jgi:hypothetical protein
MKTRQLILATALLVPASAFLTAAPMGTAFTYQGKLAVGGIAATGLYDFSFAVFDAASGGAQKGLTLNTNAVGVTNGLFTVALDFGAVFDGNGRWLDISVKTNGAGSFTALAPRQALTPAPYALYAPSAGTAGNANAVAAANITGTLAPSQLPGGVLTNNATGVSLNGTFSGNAAGLSNLPSASLTGMLTVSSGTPAGVDHIANGGSAWDVALAGRYCCVANDTDGLRIYDISDPASPVNIAHTNNGGYAGGVAVSGHYCYLGCGLGGLHIYDIANPTNLANIGNIHNGGYAYRVAVTGNYCYLANGGDGLRIYDVSNPSSPINVGHTNNGGYAFGVAVAGNYCFLGNGDDGLRVYNISDPANPVNVGHIDDGGNANSVAVSGNYCYLANGGDGLRIYDVSNPSSPINVGHTNNGGAAFGVAVAGGCCYLANSDDGLRIYDVSNPANPINTGHVSDGGLAGGVGVADNYCYLADGSDGLRIYALSVASAPAFQGSGSLLTALNASQLASGTVPDAQLAANVARTNQVWLLRGNAGTTPGANFIGTTDNQALELKANGQRILRLEPTTNSPNVIGGCADNWVAAGTCGATIGGGGGFGYANSVAGWYGAIGGGWLNVILSGATYAAIGGGSGNTVQSFSSTISGGDGNTIQAYQSAIGGGQMNMIQTAASFSTIGGGRFNTNGGAWATVPGGMLNLAGGVCSLAAGYRAKALHQGALVWADSAEADFSSVTNDTFNVRAQNGVRIHSDTGIHLDAADRPIVVRDWDLFNAGAPNGKGGIGRWGLFMEPANLVLGIASYGGAIASIACYNADGTRTNLMWVDTTGNLYTRGAVNPPSDRDAKEQFTPVDARVVLDKVAALPVMEWAYKGGDGARHLGPVAQDFKAAFGLGADDKHIATVDADGVALAAIQGLNQKLEEQRAENTELKKRLERLEMLLSKQSGGVQ